VDSSDGEPADDPGSLHEDIAPLRELTRQGGDGARSFQEAMIPVLELLQRLSPDGEIEVADIGMAGADTAIVTVRIPITWHEADESNKPVDPN
jgi:hypothetical protein